MNSNTAVISILTFERVVVTPVREYTLLDLLVETFLHSVHIFKFVGLDAFILRPFPACNGFFKRRRHTSAAAHFASVGLSH